MRAAGADFFNPKCLLYKKRHGTPLRRSVGAVGCVVLFAVRVCEVRRRNTHAAHQTPGATGFYATSLSAPVTRAFIEIEQASSATSPAKHSSPRAFRVRGKAIDAPPRQRQQRARRPLCSTPHLHRHAHATNNGQWRHNPHSTAIKRCFPCRPRRAWRARRAVCAARAPM